MRQRDDSGWAGLGTCVAVLALSAVPLVTLAGCQSTPPGGSAAASPVRSDVTDIRPTGRAAPAAVDEAATTAVYQPPIYDTSGPIPTAPQAVTGPAPVAATGPTPAAATPVLFTPSATPRATPASAAGAHGRTHVVRRGETLFAIARSAYGDGKQWRRLATANPSAAAGPLRVGQQILVP